MPAQRRHRRGQREHAGGHRDRDREDVIRQQGRGRDETRQLAQVLLRDDVGAAGSLVDADGLAVRERRRSRAAWRSRARSETQGGRRPPTRRSARRARPPSHRRPTRAGPRRRSAVRAIGQQRLVELAGCHRAADEGSLQARSCASGAQRPVTPNPRRSRRPAPISRSGQPRPLAEKRLPDSRANVRRAARREGATGRTNRRVGSRTRATEAAASARRPVDRRGARQEPLVWGSGRRRQPVGPDRRCRGDERFGAPASPGVAGARH